jgi:hypothetical protein
VRTIAITNIVYVISWDICFQFEVGFEQRWIENVILVINEFHASKKIKLKNSLNGIGDLVNILNIYIVEFPCNVHLNNFFKHR